MECRGLCTDTHECEQPTFNPLNTIIQIENGRIKIFTQKKNQTNPRGFHQIPSPAGWKRGKTAKGGGGNLPGLLFLPPKMIPAGCGRLIPVLQHGEGSSEPEALEAILAFPNSCRQPGGIPAAHPRIPGAVRKKKKIPPKILSQAHHPGCVWSKILTRLLPPSPVFLDSPQFQVRRQRPSVNSRVDIVTPGFLGIHCPGNPSRRRWEL